MSTHTLNTILKRAVGYYQSGVCVYLKSPPGQGKTFTVGECPAIISKAIGKNLGFVLVNGANLNPMDTIGYLVPKEVNGLDLSVFTKPFWWFTEEGKALTEYDGGIIFIDEADKCEVDLKKIIGEGAESGRFGPHKLPPGWVVWMAGNRSEDRSGSTRELDHLINRRMEIDIKPDPQGWQDWAMAHGVPAEVIVFADKNPDIVFDSKVPETQGPWCTPRSLVKAGRVLAAFAGPDGRLPTDPEAMNDAAGLIGMGAAAQLMATIRLGHELPDYKDIIRDPVGTKVPTKTDAQMLVCFQLAARVVPDEMEAVVTYVERLPKEFSITFAGSASRRNADLVSTQAMADWCVRNASLMSAIAGRR